MLKTFKLQINSDKVVNKKVPLSIEMYHFDGLL